MSDAGAVLLAGCGDAGCRAGLLLAAAGRRVYGLRRSEHPLPAPLQALRADLTDAATLGNLPDDIRDVIFLPAPGRRDEAAYRGLFLDGLDNLLESLQRRGIGLRRLVFVSSSAVYGEHAGAWVDEDSECQPLAFNGRLLLQAERRLAGSGAVIARCAGIYGPGRTRLIDQVVNGLARRPAGAPEFSNRIHVDDVAGALAHLVGLAQVQPCYVLSDDEPVPLDQVQSWLAQQLNLPPLPPGPALVERAVGSKRLCNRRLRASGYALRHADFRSGYAGLLSGRLPVPP